MRGIVFEVFVFEVFVFMVLAFEVFVFEVFVFEVLAFEVFVFEVFVFEVLAFEVFVFEILGLRFWGLSFPNTHHFPQFLIVKHGGITYKNLSYYQHDYSKLNAERLQNDFANINLNYLNDDSLTINAKFNLFLSSLDKLVNKHAPLKKLSKNDIRLRNKPWVSTKIQKNDTGQRQVT